MYDEIGQHWTECDAELQALLNELGLAKVDLGRGPRAGSKTPPSSVRHAPDLGQLGRGHGQPPACVCAARWWPIRSNSARNFGLQKAAWHTVMVADLGRKDTLPQRALVQRR